MNSQKFPPLVLCILDGWGKNESSFGDAIVAAKTPIFDYLNEKFPPIFINASGEFVGLPDGQMGNSEVGHLNIGAGRVVLQELPKINLAIKNGSFDTNPVISEAMAKARDTGSKYHLVGLLSDGGVHSHINHLEAFLKKTKREGLANVYIHAIMDGRDSSPHGGKEYIDKLQRIIGEVGVGKIATVSGRYYTMDRDNRWDRVEKGFNAMVLGKGVKAESPEKAISDSYENSITDEFILPTVITEGGEPIGRIETGDIVQTFNFRSDRMRQIVSALTAENFEDFQRKKTPNINLYCMTDYGEQFSLPVAFCNKPPKNSLGQILADNSVSQLRTAETEKYAHVTFFFNGGIESTYPGETRKLIPSPKVATYDLKPEMSAYEVTQQVVTAVNSGEQVVVVNLANGDMVGHTGIFDAATRAVKTVDECVGIIMEAVKKAHGHLIVTADHGNIEAMIDKHGEPITAHSTNQVPFYLISDDHIKLNAGGGSLCDVAPTLLSILKIPQPGEMTGKSLIQKK